MPRVSGYKKQVETNPLEPVRSGVQQDTQALRAAISANQPDGSAAEAQKAITQGGIRRQANAVEIQKAGNKLTEMQGMQGVQLQEQSARLTTMAGRTAAQAIQSSSEILAAMGARLTKIQDDRDTADMFNAVEEWRGYANKYWNDPESGVKATRKMNNASGVYEETRGYMNELETRVGKKLRTDDMKMKFKSAIMGHRESAERDASVWESKQMEAYTAQTTELTINNCIASAAENPTRENFNANFNTAQEALLKSIDGADDTTKALYADTLKSQFHVAIITSQANKDPLKAEQYYNAVRDEILPEVRAKLEPEISKAVMVIKGQAIAEGMLTKYGSDNLAAAQGEIRDNYSGTEEEKYLSAVNSRFTDEVQAKRVLETKQYDAMVGKIRRKSGGHQALKKEIDSLNGIDEVTRFGLYDLLDREFKVGSFSGGGSAGSLGKTDPAAYYAIWDMIDNKTLLDKAPDWKTFRALFKNKLSVTKMEEFGKMVYKNTDGGDAADPAIKLQSASIFNKYLNQEKIADPQVRARAIDRYNYEADAAEKAAAKKGMNLTYEDRVAIMGKVVAPEVVGKTQTWYGRPTDRTKRRFEIPPEAEFRDGLWYFPDPGSGKWVPLSFGDE